MYRKQLGQKLREMKRKVVYFMREMCMKFLGICFFYKYIHQYLFNAETEVPSSILMQSSRCKECLVVDAETSIEL